MEDDNDGDRFENYKEHTKTETVYENFKNDKELLPVNRSCNLGVNFNGSNFGLIGKQLLYRHKKIFIKLFKYF